MKTVAIIEDQTAIREMVSQAVIDKDAFEVIIESGTVERAARPVSNKGQIL